MPGTQDYSAEFQFFTDAEATSLLLPVFNYWQVVAAMAAAVAEP